MHGERARAKARNYSAPPPSRRSDEWRAFLCEYHRQKLGLFCCARVPADLVCAARLFVKHLSGGICPFFLARNFGDDVSFQHINEDETRMVMRSADAARRQRDNARIDVPPIHCDVRQLMVEYHAVFSCLRRLSSRACYGSGLEQREQRSDESFPSCDFHIPSIRSPRQQCSVRGNS
jgi:hypothetical protein